MNEITADRPQPPVRFFIFMKLTPEEIRMVERLRKREKSFRKVRVFSLIVDSLLLIGWFVMFLKLGYATTDAEDTTALVTRLIPVIYFLPFCLFFAGTAA